MRRCRRYFFWSWITSVDHKRVGIMYGVTAFLFFLVGGIEALLVRVQLAVPNNDFLSAESYNQLFTMHALTMIFLALMPLTVASSAVNIPRSCRPPARQRRSRSTCTRCMGP